MTALFCLFAILLLCSLRVQRKKNGFSSDYMSIESTNVIKGVFIVIIFFSHLSGYIEVTSNSDIEFYKLIADVNQKTVTPFLFFSGYGVMESVKRKGISYIKNFPQKRFLRVFVEFDIAVIIFTITRILLDFGKKSPIGAKQFFLSLIAWQSVGNSNWYIFAILSAYLLTFISFGICRCKKYPSVVLNTVLMIVYIYIFKYYNITEPHWYNTMICYVFGMWYSVLKDKIDKLVMKDAVWYPVTLIFIGLCIWSFYFYRKYFLLYEISLFLFIISIVLFSMKVNVRSKIYAWFGKHLFPMYIFQRLPMMVLQRIGLAQKNEYLFFICSFLITVLISAGFSKLTGRLWSFKIKKRKVKSL